MAKLKVDMSKVDEPIQPGNYVCIVAKVEIKDGPQAKFLAWELKIATGEQKGKTLYTNTSLAAKALFRLRDMLVAMGIKVPKSSIDIDTDKMIKKIVGVTVNLQEYEGKKRPNVTDFWKPEKDDNGKWGKPSDDSEDESAPLPGDDDVPDDDSDDDDDIEEIDV